jgi:hypothetical protein
MRANRGDADVVTQNLREMTSFAVEDQRTERNTNTGYAKKQMSIGKRLYGPNICNETSGLIRLFVCLFVWVCG